MNIVKEKTIKKYNDLILQEIDFNKSFAALLKILMISTLTLFLLTLLVFDNTTTSVRVFCIIYPLIVGWAIQQKKYKSPWRFRAKLIISAIALFSYQFII